MAVAAPHLQAPLATAGAYSSSRVRVSNQTFATSLHDGARLAEMDAGALAAPHLRAPLATAGAFSSSRGGVSDQTFATALHDGARLAKMDAGAVVSAILAIVVATREARRLVRGTTYSSNPHLRGVRVVVVPAEISGLMLGVGGRHHGGMPIFLIQETVLGFFSR
jgi:hypothetical protein